MRRNYRSLVGVLAADSLRQLRADVLFLGTSAVDGELAVWDSTMVEVPIKRAMIAAADRVVLLADAREVLDERRSCASARLARSTRSSPTPRSRAAARAAIDEAGIEVTIA